MYISPQLLLVTTSLISLSSAASATSNGLQQVVQAVGQNVNSVEDAWRSITDADTEKKKKTHHKDKKKHKDHKHKNKHSSSPLTGERVRRKMKKAGIIPSVIGDFHPSFLLNISFAYNVSPFLGTKLVPAMLQTQPNISLYGPAWDSHPEITSLPLNNLVITMTDPDAPSHSNPAWGEMCHWIAVGLPLANLSSVPSEAGSTSSPLLKEIVPWKPPGPPRKTGKHQYVLLAFTPKNATSIPLDLVAPRDRQHWGYPSRGYGVKDWAEEMGLLQIAGDFFTAKYHK